jgi:hypothetical protein
MFVQPEGSDGAVVDPSLKANTIAKSPGWKLGRVAVFEPEPEPTYVILLATTYHYLCS